MQNTSIKPKKKGVKKKTALQKKKDKPNSKYWKNKADRAWGEKIHSLYESCLVCGGQQHLEAHHLISRGRVMTRHEIENGVLLCSNHHKWSNECSPHMAPVQFTEFLRENFPEKIEYVIKNTHRIGKPDYRAAFEKLTKENTK